MRRAVPLSLATAVLLAGCGTSNGSPSGGSTKTRAVDRQGTCEIEVAALVDLDVAAVQTKGAAGAAALVPALGRTNPVLLAAETVSASVFKNGSTGGATKAIKQECAKRNYPVLDAAGLAAVRKAVPPADVAVLRHVTITR